MAMRNYAAMTDVKLVRSIEELERACGEAWEKASAAGRDPGEDLRAAREAATCRGLVPAGDDGEWDRVRREAVDRLDDLPVPEELWAAARPTAVIADDPGGGSQLGGRPRLPADTPWPTRGGRPLHHLAQLDLATAPAVLRRLGLPASGRLTCFYDAQQLFEGEGGWGEWPTDLGATVLLLVEDDDAPVADWPDDLPDDARHARVPVSLHLAADLKGVIDLLMQAEEQTFGELDGYELGDAVSLREDRGRARHQLLGLADDIQGDPMAECPVRPDDPEPPPGSPDLRAPKASDWRLLLQIDSDEESGGDARLDWMWGDVGTLYVAVQHDDLLAGRLDRAWTIMQCS